MAPDPSLTPELVHARAFTVGFRGYDQSEVRDFLNRLSTEIRSLREQIEQLESNWRSAEERAARPPVLDEETLMAAVGEETAAILRTARATAAELRKKAADDAERIRLESEGLLGDKTKEAEEAAEGILERARSEAARAIEKANAEAEEIRAKAEQERVLTIEGANATREKVLDDLSRRRRVATVQIEQLRAGRERLLESYAVVRRTLEEAQEELTRADAEARAAADEVGRKLNRDTDPAPAAASASAAPVSTPTSGGGVSTGGNGAAVAAAVERPSAPSPGDEGHQEAVPHLRVVPDLSPSGERGAAAGGHGEAAGSMEASPATADMTGAAAADDSESPADEVSPRQGETDDAASPVDQLFAKIRSGRGGRGPGAASEAGKKPAPAGGEGSEDAGAAVVEASAVQNADAPGGAPAPATQAGDEAWLQKREDAISSLEVSLTRKLKRALQDEQNDLLDRLRGLRTEVTAAALLPSAGSHKTRYTEAALPIVAEAADAGALFAANILGGEACPSPDVSSIADDAAEAIVGPLRRRLEQAVAVGGSEDQAVLIESLGAAYREWKSQRVERVSGDALFAAFSRGTWHAVPDGAALRWIVDDVDGPCPDCDDDALAGGLPKGEAFPTGQVHPPAHTGCRCLLVPVRD